MVKIRSLFVCQNCGSRYQKWVGRCDNCGSWNTLIEEAIQPDKKSAVDRTSGKIIDILAIAKVSAHKIKERLKTGLNEVDEVLGGGMMLGGVALLAGQPGIGKSTLLMQIALHIASKKQPVLYVSGEESAEQIKSRSERLSSSAPDYLFLATSTSSDDIARTIQDGKYQLVIVDSMQTMAMSEISSAPGTVSQITNSANIIIRASKATNTACILVGHVTKEGSIAGPKVLEHLVDVVLQFEGERYGGFKILRASKNRYGSTNEIALLEMNDSGLSQVDNPSAQLLAERGQTDGSVILATLEGNRPLLVEIQALVSPTHFGYPKRTVSGFDLNRLNVLIAVLEQRTKLKLNDSDVFINVVGGLKLQDPAADLAVCMAIASASAKRRLDEKLVVFGEVGLSGEIRSATRSLQRTKEAKKLNFSGAIAPESKPKDNFIRPVKELKQALNQFLTVRK